MNNTLLNTRSEKQFSELPGPEPLLDSQPPSSAWSAGLSEGSESTDWGTRSRFSSVSAHHCSTTKTTEGHNLSDHLSVLFNQFGKVVEKAVLWPQEVKLVIPLFFLHELSEKLATIAGNKLGSELDNIQIKCWDRRRIRNELKLRWWFFGNNCLLNHLWLHLLITKKY